MDNPTVFVVNHVPLNNYASCEAFGDPVYMTRGILDLRRLDKVEKVFRSYLAEALPSDYLCLSGAAVVVALALKIWFEFNCKCKILHWQGSVYHEYLVEDPKSDTV